MITRQPLRVGALLSLVMLGACSKPGPRQIVQPGPKEVSQLGYRGVGMEATYDPDDIAATAAYNQAPKPISPPAPPGPPGQYKNVQVLTGLSAGEFGRTMVSMSAWVAGNPGNCAYCHNTANFASDSLAKGGLIYTKLVARMMLRMTRHINSEYTQHVGGTGVTCYTCHRGKPLPNGLWFYTNENQILRHYLDRDDIRVQSHTVEPSNGNRTAIRQTYNTYALMITQSKALGVNCTYCHNSRAWTSWEQSTPKRVVALYGTSMARDLNMNYLNPLQPVYPRSRLGEHGDAPKLQCVTCHNGVYKPLYGAKMVKDYPALWGAPGWDAIKGPLDAAGAPLYDGKPLTAPGVTPMGIKMSAAPTTAAAAGIEVAMAVTPVTAMPAATQVPARPTP